MKTQISSAKALVKKEQFKPNTMNVTYEDDDIELVGPGAYNHPGFWKKPSLLSHYRNNPAFTFAKSKHLDRSLSIPKFPLPGVGQYNVNALLLKKSMPRISIDKSLRFQSHLDPPISDAYLNIAKIQKKIQGVYLIT